MNATDLNFIAGG